eukprot:2093699-Pyramimonas_sp.AAC.1
MDRNFPDLPYFRVSVYGSSSCFIWLLKVQIGLIPCDAVYRFRFVVVTSRQHIIQDATRQWIAKYFPGIFEDILFGNHWYEPNILDTTLHLKCKIKNSEMECVKVINVWERQLVKLGLLTSRLGTTQTLATSARLHVVLHAQCSQWGLSLFRTKDSPNPDDWNETKRTKLEMCESVGAIALIDDSCSYAKQCAPKLKKMVLYGRYGWNTKESETTGLPDNVVRADNWAEVRQILTELCQ